MNWPSASCESEVVAMITELTPTQQRCQDSLFVAKLSFPALLATLPLSLPVPDDIPASPKRRYRSHYLYLGYQDLLADKTLWSILSFFDLALRLIDFGSLEAPLAHKVYSAPKGHPAKGQTPFHPVSMFLLFTWQILTKWKRTETLRNLANPLYADYRQRFGFSEGNYPTEGGLRHFETQLGCESGNDLIAQTVRLAQAAYCISKEATEHGTLTVDGMIHDAASRLNCKSVGENCYRPAPRPCRAKEEKGRRGCDCDEIACATVCKDATPRDPDARFIVYQGHNQTDSPNSPHPNQSSSEKAKSSSGKPRYGYRSVCMRLIDPVLRTSWVLANELLSATAPEDQTATTLMKGVVSDYEWVKWHFAVADAGEGREPFLSTAYRLGLRRVVGLRAAEGDKKTEVQELRGYDDKGIPLCQHGYRLHPNGWDSKRRRHKWCCRRTCEAETERPAPDCPFRCNKNKHGFTRTIGLAFRDKSTRLVRDVPYGSPLWNQLYGRGRNAAEERNSQFEGFGLKSFSRRTGVWFATGKSNRDGGRCLGESHDGNPADTRGGAGCQPPTSAGGYLTRLTG